MKFPFETALEYGLKIIDRVVPDPAAKQAAQLELLRLQQAGEFKQIDSDLQASLAQVEVNKVEASNPNFFVSGWRPAAGWVCVLGLFYSFLLRPLISYIGGLFGAAPAPAIDMANLLVLLGGLLGLGGLRTFDKIRGVAS
jgi:Holin of 3TMs, for gene-transfer release